MHMRSCCTWAAAAVLIVTQASPGQSTKTSADEDAIRQNSLAFTKAFEAADAKAVAAFWTENGEYQEESGVLLRGRPAIESAFSKHFKEIPKAKVEVIIDSIRFPAPNLAVEEGYLRQAGAGKELPGTTLYRVIHVRDGKEWKIALAKEWGAGHDRLHNLHWLLGSWKAAVEDQEVVLTLKQDEKPFLVGTFVKKAKGKTISSGSLRIAFDGQRGKLRSWHFDDDGGHGEALWVRDGNRWLLDSVGVTGAGDETASVNVLTRLSNREITWRSIDRVVAGTPLPDTTPTKLTRVE